MDPQALFEKVDCPVLVRRVKNVRDLTVGQALGAVAIFAPLTPPGGG
jgi:hypothetical protein